MRFRLVGLVGLVFGGPLASVTSCGTNASTVRTPPCTTTLPVAPTAPTNSSIAVSTYAIDTVFLGDVGRNGTTYSTTAWQDFGLDLDGNGSDARSIDVCTRAAGAPSSVQTDGRCGTDNSFGANVILMLQSILAPSPCIGCNQKCEPTTLSPLVSDALHRGVYTLQLTVTGLDGTATQTARGLSLQTFPSLDFDPVNAPKFTLDEDWPVLANGLENASDIASGAKARFSAFITNGVFVSGFGSMSIEIPFAGVLVSIPIRHAVIMMSVSAGGMRVTNGTLAGVIATDDLVKAFQHVAGASSKFLCGNAFDGIAQQLRQTSDILVDGTNRAGLWCDGVSVGIGFEGRRIGNPKRISPAPSESDPCPLMDSGTE